MVLVTFRFFGLARLHSLWGCLAFVGFPSGFGLVCLGLCPLGFLFAVLVGFSLGCLHLWCGLGALASRRHGVVCSRWAFALGLHGVLSWWAAAAAAVAAPSLCAVYLGAVQIKVHTLPQSSPHIRQAAMDVEDMRRKRLFSRWASSRWTPSRPGVKKMKNNGGKNHPTTFK